MASLAAELPRRDVSQPAGEVSRAPRCWRAHRLRNTICPSAAQPARNLPGHRQFEEKYASQVDEVDVMLMCSKIALDGAHNGQHQQTSARADR